MLPAVEKEDSWKMKRIQVGNVRGGRRKDVNAITHQYSHSLVCFLTSTHSFFNQQTHPENRRQN